MRLAAPIGLFFLSFAHEETAIITGGYLVTSHGMDVVVVLVALTAGVIAGDWAIYWLGASSRRLKVLERFLRSEKTVRSGEWLDRRLLLVIVVARLFPGPGILFPVFSSIGLLGIGFARFAVRSAAVAAVYTPAMLYLTILYGDAVAPHLGWWAWPTLLLVSLVGVGGPWVRGLRHVVGEWVGLHDERGADGNPRSTADDPVQEPRR